MKKALAVGRETDEGGLHLAQHLRRFVLGGRPVEKMVEETANFVLKEVERISSVKRKSKDEEKIDAIVSRTKEMLAREYGEGVKADEKKVFALAATLLRLPRKSIDGEASEADVKMALQCVEKAIFSYKESLGGSETIQILGPFKSLGGGW